MSWSPVLLALVCCIHVVYSKGSMARCILVQEKAAS
jgi:hypothetical protein